MTTPENIKNEALTPMTGEIVLYQPDETVRLEVRIDGETAWLNRQQMAQLFDRDVKTIGKHVNNALTEELRDFSVVAKFATTAADGKTYQMEHYNLDMILSVGYRVKSEQGIRFRRWATRVLKEFLLRGYVFDRRIERVESMAIETHLRVAENEKKIDFLQQYVEEILADNNDINEDTRMQLEDISKTLAELQKTKWIGLN
jgi:hypothetical protein